MFDVLLRVLPDKDCERCEFREPAWRDGGHCYMFRDEPAGEKCGQFRRSERMSVREAGQREVVNCWPRWVEFRDSAQGAK